MLCHYQTSYVIWSWFLIFQMFSLGVGHMIIGDLQFDILVHHGMHNIHLVQTIRLLQDEGVIPGLLFPLLI